MFTIKRAIEKVTADSDKLDQISQAATSISKQTGERLDVCFEIVTIAILGLENTQKARHFGQALMCVFNSEVQGKQEQMRVFEYMQNQLCLFDFGLEL